MRRTRRPVPTLTLGSPNKIVAVSDNKIERLSPRSRGRPHPIYRKSLYRSWRDIAKPGGGVPRGWYFIRPLLLNAFRGVVRHDEGHFWLEGDPQIAIRKATAKAKARRRTTGSGRAGGGSLLHRELKDFILHEPNRALSGISGGPFVAHDVEYLFKTGDEVDVRLSDANGRPVLVEVKPDTNPRNDAPWGQAAKYRTLWAFFNRVSERDVRVIVAAPRIPRNLASAMKRLHNLESVVVTLPSKRRRYLARVPGAR
jgi:hypothetical protein